MPGSPLPARLCRYLIGVALFLGVGVSPSAVPPPPAGVGETRQPALDRSGVVVDDLQPGSAAAVAGLRPDDTILGWRRLDDPDRPGTDIAPVGPLADVWAFEQFAIEILPRSRVALEVRRDAELLAVDVPLRTSRLGVGVRPALDADLTSLWRRISAGARTAPSDGSSADASRLFAQLADRGSEADAAWLRVRLAAQFISRRAFDQAGALLAEAVAAPAVAADPMRMRVVRGAIVDLAIRQSRWEQATVAIDEALSQEGGGTETSSRAGWLMRRAALLRQQGRLDDARRDAEASLAIRRVLAPGSWDEADAVAELGRIAVAARRLDEAVPHFEAALAIVERAQPTIETVRLGLAQTDLDWRRGRVIEAERRVRTLIDLTASLAPDSVEQARNLNQLGILRSQSGDLPAAERAFQSAWAIYARLDPGGIDEASALNNLGIAAMQRGRYAEAESFYRRSLEMKERLRLPPLERATTYGNLGLMSIERRDLASARDYLTRALNLIQAAAPGSLQMAGGLSNLARSERLSGRLDEAERLARQSLEIRARLAPNTVLHAFTLSELGKVLEAASSFEAAAAVHRQALAIREQLAPEGSNVADSLDALGRLAAQRGAPDEAVRLHERAGSIWQKVAPGSVYEGLNLVARARLDAAGGRVADARNHYARATDIFDELTGSVGGAFDTQADFRGGLAASYAEYAAFLLAQGDAPEAFRVSERARARVFLAMLAERDVVLDQDAPPGLLETRRSLTTEYDRIQRELGTLSPARDAARIDERVGRLRDVRLQLAATNAEIGRMSPRAGAIDPSLPLDVEGARRALPQDTAAVAYLVGERRSHGFVISSRGFDVFDIPMGRQAFADRVDRLMRLIERRDAAPEPLIAVAAELYQALVAPAEAVLTAHVRLLVVPDGPLHQLPFAALVREDSGSGPSRQYLVEWRPVHQVPSLTFYGRLPAPNADARGDRARLLAVGSPLYAAADDAVGGNRDASASRPSTLPPLPGSRREVDALRALYGTRALTLLDEQASEPRVRQALPDADIVHLAVHGLVNSRSPLDSALAFSSRSGSTGEDNGLLQAWEIVEQVRLRAGLVVLSACDTAGSGESGGEGLLGLTRAFQFAGASSVVASLWRVPDELTPTLMQELHRHVRRGAPVDEALARAQRMMLRRPETAHPYNWAAFILSGRN
jgi:CHAT domain-containing protein/tetratricopeptide (TPR) repeat protein